MKPKVKNCKRIILIALKEHKTKQLQEYTAYKNTTPRWGINK